MEQIGVWVVACTPQCEIVKWGKDGDTEQPFTSREEAQSHADYLTSTAEHSDDGFYLLFLYSNGQIRTEEYYEDSHQ